MRNGEDERLCMDDMLQRHCGEFGRWQMKQFVLTSLAWGLEAIFTMIMIFSDDTPRWTCKGPGCSAGSSLCDLDPKSWEWSEKEDFSTVTEWGLICGQKYKVGLVQALFFASCLIGAGVYGRVSDSMGRKKTLRDICMINLLSGCATVGAKNYYIYVISRVFTGFATGGIGVIAFVLATETIGPSKRCLAGMCTFYFFSSGIVLLCGLAYVLKSWRRLYLASSILSFVYLTIVIPFISESPRWFLVRGRVNEAMEVMHSIANTNGRHIPPGVTLTLDNDQEISDNPPEGTLRDILRSSLMRGRFLVAITISFTVSVVYYGLTLNVVNLKTNINASVLLNAVGEMPAFALTAALVDQYGRKTLTIGTQWFSGLFCLFGFLLGGVGDVGPWMKLRLVSGVFGIFGMAGAYNLMLIYVAELFPTVVRNTALGCMTQAVQMGAILAPFVVLSGEDLPLGVFAVCGLVGGGLAFYLPETLNQPLYDTISGIEDGESIRSEMLA